MVTPFATMPGDVHGAALDLVLGVDDQDVAALVVGQHRRLRQHRCAAALLTVTSARAKAPGRRFGIGRERDSHSAQAGLRIDDRAEQAHLARDTSSRCRSGARSRAGRPSAAAGPARRPGRAARPRRPRPGETTRRRRASPVCPTSTLRVRMMPSAGARTSARARRASASASCAAATLTFAAAVTELERRRSVSSADSAPEAPTAMARWYSAAARSASARASSSEPPADWRPAAASTETSIRASAWPRLT